jgi:hypothetical protein
MTYYIVDTTVGNKPLFFNTLYDVLVHLEGSCKRIHGISRAEYMQNLADLGHSADESSGRNFLIAMSEIFNIGVVKEDRLVRCDVFNATHYSKYLTEMGD